MSRVVVFNKSGYEPFFDYVKAYAILCVLIGHTFPCVNKMGYFFWAGMQVPLFVLVQAFHALKKTAAKLNIRKIITRVFVPFLLVTVGVFVIFVLSGNFSKALIFSALNGGGCGPGAYYPWVYIQLALILVVIRPLLDKGTMLQQGLIAILICEGGEILSALISLPDWIHRLLAIRYLFLIYLAWIWVKKGIVINKLTILLSLLSMASIAYFEYFANDLTPFFFNTAWKCHRWPCYYYVSTLGCYLLYLLYQFLSRFGFIDRIIKLLAKCSYEIFLLQMGCIAVLQQLNVFSHANLSLAIRILLIWFISIFGGYIFNKAYVKIINLV